MTTFEKLQKRIEKDTGINLVNFQRTYAGHWQRANGCWLWRAYVSDDSSWDFGSCHSATELLKSKSPLVLGDPKLPFARQQEIEMAD